MKIREVILVLGSPRVWLPSIGIAILYIGALNLFMNSALVHEAFVGGFPFADKMKLLLVALTGMWSFMTPAGDVAVLLLALLTGLTATLSVLRVRRIRSLGKTHLIASSGAILGMIGSGCAACSLPVFSLLGFAGSTAFLPFGGEEILWIALGLQIVSLYYILKTEIAEGVCVVGE